MKGIHVEANVIDIQVRSEDIQKFLVTSYSTLHQALPLCPLVCHIYFLNVFAVFAITAYAQMLH